MIVSLTLSAQQAHVLAYALHFFNDKLANASLVDSLEDQSLCTLQLRDSERLWELLSELDDILALKLRHIPVPKET